MSPLVNKKITGMMLLTATASLATPVGKPSVGRLARDLLPFRCNVDSADHAGLVDGINCEWDWWAHSGSDFQPQPLSNAVAEASSTQSRDAAAVADIDQPRLLISGVRRSTPASQGSSGDVFDIMDDWHAFASAEEKKTFLASHTECASMSCYRGFILGYMNCLCHTDDADGDIPGIVPRSSSWDRVCGPHHFDSIEERLGWLAEHPEVHREDMHCIDINPLGDGLMCHVDCDVLRSRTLRNFFDGHYFESAGQKAAFEKQHPECKAMPCTDAPATGHQLCTCHEENEKNNRLPALTNLPALKSMPLPSPSASSKSPLRKSGNFSRRPKSTVAIPNDLDTDVTITMTSTMTSTTFVARATDDESLEVRDVAAMDSTLAVMTIWPETTSYFTTTTAQTLEVIMPDATRMGSTVVEVEQTSTSTSTTTMATPFDNGSTTTSVVWETIYQPEVTPESTVVVWETVIESQSLPESTVVVWETLSPPLATVEPTCDCQEKEGEGCGCTDSDTDDDDDDDDDDGDDNGSPCKQEGEKVEQMVEVSEQKPAGMRLGVPVGVTKSCTKQEEADSCFQETDASLAQCGKDEYACQCKALNQRVSCFDYCDTRGKPWAESRKLRSLFCNQAAAFPPAASSMSETATQTMIDVYTASDAPTPSASPDSAFSMMAPMAGGVLATVFGVVAFVV